MKRYHIILFAIFLYLIGVFISNEYSPSIWNNDLKIFLSVILTVRIFLEEIESNNKNPHV